MLAHRAHIVLLGVALDQLHAEAQLRSRYVLHILFHRQPLQYILVVDSYRVYSVLIRQYNACFCGFERGSTHICLAHARTALQVLDQVLIFRIVQKHFNLTVRLNVLQYNRMSLLTAMVDMEKFLNKCLQCM